jgi:hypothetical protein
MHMYVRLCASAGLPDNEDDAQAVVAHIQPLHWPLLACDAFTLLQVLERMSGGISRPLRSLCYRLFVSKSLTRHPSTTFVR